MSNRTKLPKGVEASPAAENFAPISRHTQRGRPFGADNPGKPFPLGHSGRPKGARNKATTVLRSMFDGEAAKIGRRAIELAHEGRVGAIRLILDRAYPARQGRTVEGLRLPAMNSAGDAVAAMGAVTQAISAGVLTIDEARDLSVIIDTYRKIYELAEIESRIVALERTTLRSPLISPT